MTDEEIAVARELVKARGFRWVAGMLAVDLQPQVWDSIRIGAARVDEDGDRPGWSYGHAWYPLDTPVPDLADPATLGCLLALTREVWGQPDLYVMREGATWGVHYPDGSYGHDSSETVAGLWDEPSEGIALARAIIASRAD